MYRGLAERVQVVFFFFFQAEDGIRDLTVTGVQTCALPICPTRTRRGRAGAGRPPGAAMRRRCRIGSSRFPSSPPLRKSGQREGRKGGAKIGRASCRERV